MTKPTRSEEVRSGLETTMASGGVPTEAAVRKINRHMEGLKTIQKGEQQGVQMMILAMALVALLAVLQRLTSWTLLFFAIPLIWGAAQAARGAVLLSSDVLKHMDERSFKQLSWFQRWIVMLAKQLKGIA